MKTMKYLEKNIDLGLLVMRLGIGVLMLLHGVFKLTHGVGFIEQVVLQNGLPSFMSYGVYVGEVVTPILIIIGYATRGAALIYAFNCFVAAMLVHIPMLFTLNEQGGWAVELLGLYFLGALALVFTGGGKYALSSKHIWD